MSTFSSDELLKRAAQARREGRLREDCADATEAVSLSRLAKGPEGLARALMMLGQLERDNGRPRNALPRYEEAVAIARNGGDPLRLAHMVRHLANLHCEVGRLDLAETGYAEALAVYRHDQRAGRLDLSNALRGYAAMKDAAGASREARPLWEEARNLYAEIGVKEGVAECTAKLRG